MSDHLQMASSEIGIVFLITLVAIVPGAMVGSVATKKTNPNTSLKICLCLFIVFTIGGAFALAGPELAYMAYVWAIFWGLSIG